MPPGNLQTSTSLVSISDEAGTSISLILLFNALISEVIS